MDLPTLEEFFIAHGKLTRQPRTVLPFHRRIFTALTQWTTGRLPDGKRHLMILMPPRHGKTYIARDLVAWATGALPESNWIYVSYAAEIAREQTVRIRETMGSDWYKAIYPWITTRPDKDRQDKFYTGCGGEVYAVGAGGPITGKGAGLKRREFSGGVIIDDPIKPDDARSPTIRGNVNSWYTGTLKSRRNLDDTPMLLIMQRLHEDDLAGHLMRIEPEDWHVLQIPALDDATGEMLWTETFSYKSAEKLRIVDPGTFYAQYQQSPVAPGGNILKKDWWRRFNLDDFSPQAGLIFLTADTAYKAKAANDASVIQVWHGTRERLTLLDGVSGRWEFPELLGRSKEFWNKWADRGARYFYIEDKASGASLEQTLRQNGVLKVRGWKPGSFRFPEDKVGRVNEAAWAIHGGAVWLPEGTPFADALIEEAAAFAADLSHAHDDHVDAMTMAVSIWRHAGGKVPTE